MGGQTAYDGDIRVCMHAHTSILRRPIFAQLHALTKLLEFRFRDACAPQKSLVSATIGAGMPSPGLSLVTSMRRTIDT